MGIRRRVLLACQPIPGHLHPNLALAQALAARGHAVAIYSGAEAGPAVNAEGHRFYRFQASLDEALARMLRPPADAPGASGAPTGGPGARAGGLGAALREFFIDPIPAQIEDLREVAADFRPDVLVTDVTLMAPTLILTHTAGVPVAVFSPLAACSVPGPDAPPWGRGLPPPRTWPRRLRSALERRVIDWLTRDLRAAASAMRRRYGLPPIAGRLSDEYRAVPLFLVCTTPAFDYLRRDLPPTVHYVGACTWRGGAAPAPPPAWLASLDDTRPVVHVTEGTIHTRAAVVLRAAVAGLSDRPVQVVMTTGRHRRLEELDLGEIGPNVRVEPYVPHHHLLPRTDVVVTTGGAGTINTALVAGVPLVVVPAAWDWPEHAQRVVEAGVGVRLDPRRCTPRRLREAIERVLAHAGYRERAGRLGAALAREGGAERAAALVERLSDGPGAGGPAVDTDWREGGIREGTGDGGMRVHRLARL